VIKLIKHTGECDGPDDPSLPFRLDLIMRAPSLNHLVYVFLYGGVEEVVARADSVDELVEWMHKHGLRDHPRLLRFFITDPDGKTVYNIESGGQVLA